ncbi:TetR/AcrR family transcriptional regulator [Martelella sp. HB161492]|uniref:TetR/AcrR family transcriptional regulator n=1 Tax=Martelella sp. HB161492 TaxID=2720726 RepID=UPI00159028CA|nr:TetR/AcrR family transcriptional regulator [Martelella sp. HB161492]
MPRPRKHDQNAILDAVERVVARDGIVTLDAVAREAGVSKATVIYDHSNKRELIAALVARTMKADNDFNEAAQAEFSGKPNAALRGRIEAARRSPPVEGGNAAVLSLVVGLLQDAALRAGFRDNQRAIGQTILAGAGHPRAARLAWLALEGLKYQQHLEFQHWSAEEREEILCDIELLACTATLTEGGSNA